MTDPELRRFPDGLRDQTCSECGAAIPKAAPRYKSGQTIFCEHCGKNRVAAAYAPGFKNGLGQPSNSARETTGEVARTPVESGAVGSSSQPSASNRAETPKETTGTVPNGPGDDPGKPGEAAPAPREEAAVVPAGVVKLWYPQSYATYSVKSEYGREGISLGAYARHGESDEELLARVMKTVREAADAKAK